MSRSLPRNTSGTRSIGGKWNSAALVFTSSAAVFVNASQARNAGSIASPSKISDPA